MQPELNHTAAAPRSNNINIRVTPETLGLIDRAARIAGKTRTDFILDTVRRVAEDTILDQRLFVLDQAQWDAFVALLDATSHPNEGLAALMARRPNWET